MKPNPDWEKPDKSESDEEMIKRVIRRMIESGQIKKIVAEAVEIAIAKIKGKVI